MPDQGLQVCTELVTAFTGALGFGVLFNIKRDKLLPAAFGGFLGWAVYLALGRVLPEDAIRYLLAAMIVTVYAEVMARRKKTPATIFVVPGIVPMVPGGSLYYTMRYLVEGNQEAFRHQSVYTLLLAGAIAGGILCAMTLWRIIARLTRAEFMQKK